MRRTAGFLLALVGNLSILGLPVAHGYAHSELAHVETEHPEQSHEHPELSATVTAKMGTLLVAALLTTEFQLPAIRDEQ